MIRLSCLLIIARRWKPPLLLPEDAARTVLRDSQPGPHPAIRLLITHMGTLVAPLRRQIRPRR